MSCLLNYLQVQAVETPGSLYALSACLMDAESGRILYGKEADTKRANASTTKIMTLIVTLENCNLNDIVTISDQAARQPDVQLNCNAKEQFRLKDLCYSLMLESHNDSAVAIAEHVAGSTKQFADMMNQKAKEIGCSQTYFITPNGLDASDEYGFHGTTAKELAKIMRYCILESDKKEAFLEITRTSTHEFMDISKKRSFVVSNKNAYLQMNEHALTGKTGFTSDAGYCYVGVVRDGEKTLIVSLLGCGWPYNKNYKWSDSDKLFSYGLEKYEKICLTDSGFSFECKVKDGCHTSGDYYLLPTVILEVNNPHKIEMLLSKNEKIVKKICFYQSKLSKDNKEYYMTAPIDKGKVVGDVRYFLIKENGEQQLIKKQKITVKETVKKMDFSFVLSYVCKQWTAL